jgi:anaerobic ribonucleoside-triphosphate reductase activating protein
MNLAGFYDESISNGIGWRAVVFVSGCPHHCINCHNPDAQDYNYGTPFNATEIIEKITNNSILNGVTITGGEPLSPENMLEVLDFIKLLKQTTPNLNIWCYTGYTYENLLGRNDTITNEILENIDVLIDGPFIEEEKNPTLKFRGSENQRIIDVRKTLTNNSIVLVDV